MHSRKRKSISVPVVILLDLLLTMLILGMFVLFQIVIPARQSAAASKAKMTASHSVTDQQTEMILSQDNNDIELLRSEEVMTLASDNREEPFDPEPTDRQNTTEENSASQDNIIETEENQISVPCPTPEPTPTPTPAPTPDLRTPWQKKFESFFSDEVIHTENSYSSPNVSIQIETKSIGEGSKKSVYHVADIHIGSIDCFKTYIAHGVYTYFDTEDILDMDKAVDALLAIGGDFCTYQKSGFFLRNGEIARNDHSWGDMCILYGDGTMECITNGMYSTNEDLLEKGALHVWNFGPSLLNSDGQIRYDYYASQSVMYPNPRSAIGYYEPGHYCFVVVDGRQNGYSRGMLLNELAGVFQDLGCKCAYNLDGGGSAVMTFNHERYSQQSNGADRMLGDILYICEPED